MAKAKARVASSKEAAKLGIIVYVDIKDDETGFILDNIDQYATTLNGDRKDSPRYLNDEGTEYKTIYRFFNWDQAKEFADTLNKQMLYGLG